MTGESAPAYTRDFTGGLGIDIWCFSLPGASPHFSPELSFKESEYASQIAQGRGRSRDVVRPVYSIRSALRQAAVQERAERCRFALWRAGREGMAGLPTSIPEAVVWLRERFRWDAAQALAVRYQIQLAGAGGGSFGLIIDNGRLEAAEGLMPAPDVVYRMRADDFFALLAGRENPDLLFLAERIEIDGDLSLALKLRSLFDVASGDVVGD